MMDNVTLVITSCGRLDLLKKTVESFFKFNTYPIYKTIIIDDSGKSLDFTEIKSYIIGPFEIIANEHNIGQIKSIDIAYSKVETDYIFHCEDDWEFISSGFIEKSFEILKSDLKIITVWLRAYSEKKIKNQIDKTKKFKLPSTDDFYYLTFLHPTKIWRAGFTFNPGLRRTTDAMLFHPYEKQKVRFIKNGIDEIGETDLMVYYREAGYRAAITSNENGYVRHIGGKQHIMLPWERAR